MHNPHATNQEAGPEDVDVLDHGSIDPILLDSLAEESGCSTRINAVLLDQSLVGVKTESLGDNEVAEWGSLPLFSSIDQGASAHPAVHTLAGVARCESAAPRKRLRIRMGRESQATTVVGVDVTITLYLHWEPAQR